MKTIRLNQDIELRQIQLADIEDIFNAIDSQRGYLGKWLPFIESAKSIEDTRAFVESIVNSSFGTQEFIFVIHHKNQFTGLVGFNNTDKSNRRTMIGYWLCEQFQGKGIMTTAVKALCNFAFTELNINRIQINCATENEPSKRIPIRLGFTYEGTERDGELLSGNKFTDIAVYSKLLKDWLKE